MTKFLSNPLRSLLGIGGVAALALVAAPAAIAENHEDETAAEAMTEGEQELAELLEGRVAGEPVSCIRSHVNDRMRVIDETAYVYGRGKTIYVQRTRDPEDIDDRDTLVSRRFSASQLCKLDQMTTIDAFSGMLTGVVFFDDFVPYTRVDGQEAG